MRQLCTSVDFRGEGGPDRDREIRPGLVHRLLGSRAPSESESAHARECALRAESWGLKVRGRVGLRYFAFSVLDFGIEGLWRRVRGWVEGLRVEGLRLRAFGAGLRNLGFVLRVEGGAGKIFVCVLGLCFGFGFGVWGLEFGG